MIAQALSARMWSSSTVLALPGTLDPCYHPDTAPPSPLPRVALLPAVRDEKQPSSLPAASSGTLGAKIKQGNDNLETREGKWRTQNPVAMERR